ncbi:MAG TPA: ribonuclease P protein component [Clostridia bacterium]|nr:ribonuclease P protein component [Clostridia bacterium]
MQQTVSLKENREFRRLYKKGRSYVSPVVVVYMLKNKKQYNRIGITTGKKLGKAVIRNRVKRIIREAYSGVETQTKTGWDFVFVARNRAVNLKSWQMMKTLKGLFIQAGVWKK